MAVSDFPIIDWSPLAKLPEIYHRAQERAREQEFRRQLSGLPAGPGGVPDYAAAVSLALRSGNLGAVEPLSRIMTAQAQRQQSQQALAETMRHHRATEEIARGARQAPRQMTLTDIGKLSEEGGKYADLTRFTETWRPEFGGYKLPAAGTAANVAGRFLPEGVVGKDVAQGAAWWQGYDRYKNVVRNDLFGSALTRPEQAAFEQADINPGMDPKQIEKNLATQKLIVKNGLIRKANAAITAGYDPKAIAAAYGLDLGELGVTAQPRGATAPPPPVQYDDPNIVDARTAIARGVITRAEAERRLRDAGIRFDPRDLDLQ
jgi:hypothetical protein